jgi:hypothetical protein
MSLFKLPKCKSTGGYDECTGDSDFECEYPRQDSCKYDNYIEDCTECLCSWDAFGGRINPKTNRKWPFLFCFILFGVPFRHQPCCGNCKFIQDQLHDGDKFEVIKCPIMNRCVEPDDGIGCRWFEGKWEKEDKKD